MDIFALIKAPPVVMMSGAYCISAPKLFVLTKFVLETPDKIATNGSSNERCYRAYASPDADGLEVRYAVYHNCNHDYDKEGDTPNLAPIPINFHKTHSFRVMSILTSPPQIVTPSIPLTSSVVGVIALVSVCLLLERYTPIGSTIVSEQANDPFKPVQNVERHIPQFLHLLGVRTLMVQGLPPYRRITLVKKRPEQVDAKKLSRREMLGKLHFHSVTKLLLLKYLCSSGFPPL